MAVVSSVLTFLWLLIAFAIGIYVIRLHFEEKETFENFSIVHNYQSQYTGGFSEGHIVNQIRGKRRDAIEFIPKDVNYLKYFREKRDPPGRFRIWYEKNQRDDLVEGTISGEKNKIIIYAQNPEEYPEAFKKTDTGKAIMNMTKDKVLERRQTDILRSESDRTFAIAKELGGREPISEDWFKMIVARQNQALEAVTKEKEEKKSSSSYGGSYEK